MATPAHAWSIVTYGRKVCAKHLANLSMHEGPFYVNISASAGPVPDQDCVQAQRELPREVSEMARLSTYFVK